MCHPLLSEPTNISIVCNKGVEGSTFEMRTAMYHHLTNCLH